MKAEIITCDVCGKEQTLTGDWHDGYHFYEVYQRQPIQVSHKTYHWHFCSDVCLVKYFLVEGK